MTSVPTVSRLSLSRSARKAVLLLHVLSSVSWIGVDLVMGALALRGLTTGDPRTMATVYAALEMFCIPLLLTLGLLALTTGLLLERDLGRITVAELREVITDAWLAKAPKRLAAQLLGGS